MTAMFRIALANLHHPASPAESVDETTTAIATAAKVGARVVCFPECFVPGYRSVAKAVPPPNARFLEDAWRVIGAAAKAAHLTVVLGTERLDGDSLHASALVIGPDGTRLGFQDKVQIDPSEEGTLCAGKRASSISGWPAPLRGGDLPRGVALPRDGPVGGEEGAQVVFHPQFHEAERGSYRPKTYGDPANSFHEKAVLCRAAENSCYFATVELCQRGVTDHLGRRGARRDAAELPAVRAGGVAHRRPGPVTRDRPPREAVPAGLAGRGGAGS